MRHRGNKLQHKCLVITAIIISVLSTADAFQSTIGSTYSSSFVSLLLVRQMVLLEGSILQSKEQTYDDDDDDDGDESDNENDNEINNDYDGYDDDDDDEDNEYQRRGRGRQQQGQGQEQTGRPITTRRDPPCLNFSRECATWSSMGHCQKEDTRVYMKDNCSLACNYCNNLLKPNGVTQETHFDEFTTLSRERSRMLWNDPEYDHRNDMVAPNAIVKYTSSNYLEQRIQNILAIQDHYLNMYISDNQLRQFVTKTCLNRHPNCGLWAAQGFCELKPTSMAETCTLVCHFCDDRIPTLITPNYKTNKDINSESAAQVVHHSHRNTKDESSPGDNRTPSTTPSSSSKSPRIIASYHVNSKGESHTNPFQRMDLLGIMEAIIERRVVIQIDATIMKNLAGYWMSANMLLNGNRMTKVFASDALEISGYTLEQTITENAVVKNSNGDGRTAAPTNINGDSYNIPFKYNVTTTITNDTIYYPASPSIATKAKVQRTRNQHLVILDKFLGPEECSSLLDTIGYGIGVDTSAGLAEVNKDGFPPRTADIVYDDIKARGNGGCNRDDGGDGKCGEKKHYISRSSSRVYLYPSLNNNDSSSSSTSSNHPIQQRSRRGKLFAPAVERLLTKIGLITGLSSEVTDYIEYPIRVDKFEARDFEGGKRHFDEDQALIGEEESRMADRMVNLFDTDDDYNYDEDEDDLDDIFGDASSSSRKEKRKKLRFNDELTDVIFDTIPHDTPNHPETTDIYVHRHHLNSHRKPRSMRNARILGLTIFLNDVERGGGLKFPNADEKKGGLVVEPVLGRLVLFPTVLDLMGRKNVGKGGDGIDAKYRATKGMDKSVLVEDLGTTAAHSSVEAGTKYSVTIYLRRYARNNK